MKPLSLAWLWLRSPTRELERHQLHLRLRIRLASASELPSKIPPIVREPDCLCPRLADTPDHLSPISSVSTALYAPAALLECTQRYKASLSAPLPLYLSCPLSVRLACSSVHTRARELSLGIRTAHLAAKVQGIRSGVEWTETPKILFTQQIY